LPQGDLHVSGKHILTPIRKMGPGRWEQREEITVENENAKPMNEMNLARKRRGFTIQSETDRRSVPRNSAAALAICECEKDSNRWIKQFLRREAELH
jgi:hypothetical protein